LSSDNVDTSNFLSDGVLDLNSGVDLDEVVAVLLINQELGGTSVAVVDGFGESDSVVQDGLASLFGQVLCRGKLDDLLVASLDTAVTLEQVDDVTVAVTQKLDFNVLGAVQEALDEDGAVTKGRLGFGCGTLEGLLELLLLPDDSHTTTTTTKGSLDDDGESVLVGEALDFFELLDGAVGAGNDGDLALDGELTGRDLVTESINGVRGRANELWRVSETHKTSEGCSTHDHASSLDLASKLGVLT
jgi:hypothetical protein